MLLSQHIETTLSSSLVSRGGFGYLLKDRILDVDDFMDALAAWPPVGRRSTPRWWRP